MGAVEINFLRKGEIKQAADVISLAFYTTPVVEAVFKGSGEKQRLQLRTGWIQILKRLPGDVYVAKVDGEILGVMRAVKSPQCQVSPLQGLLMLPGMFITLRGIAPRLLKFRGIWAKNDPAEKHLHLDPITVVPTHQGKGVGSRLLERFCEIADSDGLPSYLETDQERNVRLYENFGFEVVGGAPVFGVDTWFMWRKAA